MANPPVRVVFPAHRFLEEDRGTDSIDGRQGLCCERANLDGSGEFCSHAFSHSVHHGTDETRYEYTYEKDG